MTAPGTRPDFITPVRDGMEPTDECPEPWTPELLARLDEMQRVRDRGAAEGASYFIGGAP